MLTGLRSELVDAADRLIRERGVAALTTRDIAREAGCSDGALYTHFPGKADLLMAVCQERLPDLRGQIGDLVSRVGSGTVAGNLEAIVRATQQFMRGLVPITNAVASAPELRQRWREHFRHEVIPPRRTVEALSEYIAAEQRIGRVGRHVNPRVVASLAIGACFASASAEYVFDQTPHGFSDEHFARTVARALWDGMAPKEEKQP